MVKTLGTWRWYDIFIVKLEEYLIIMLYNNHIVICEYIIIHRLDSVPILQLVTDEKKYTSELKMSFQIVIYKFKEYLLWRRASSPPW
jgi:hypothetical protein